MSDEAVFLLESLDERLALATELNHSLAVGQLLRQLWGQFGRGVGIDGQRHEPGQLLDDFIGRSAQEGSLSVESDLPVEVVPDRIRLMIENLVSHR